VRIIIGAVEVNSAKESNSGDVRKAVRERSKGRCEERGDKGHPLELHRVTCWLRDSDGGRTTHLIFGDENEDDLLALCRDCHQLRHLGPKGEFYIDPEDCAMAHELKDALRDYVGGL
jgi:hypothetical protein